MPKKLLDNIRTKIENYDFWENILIGFYFILKLQEKEEGMDEKDVEKLLTKILKIKNVY